MGDVESTPAQARDTPSEEQHSKDQVAQASAPEVPATPADTGAAEQKQASSPRDPASDITSYFQDMMSQVQTQVQNMWTEPAVESTPVVSSALPAETAVKAPENSEEHPPSIAVAPQEPLSLATSEPKRRGLKALLGRTFSCINDGDDDATAQRGCLIPGKAQAPPVASPEAAMGA